MYKHTHTHTHTHTNTHTQPYTHFISFPGGSVVKNRPASAEDQVQSLDQKDPLEEEIATHSSILAWEISWTGWPGRLLSTRFQRVGYDLESRTTKETYT